MILFSLSAVSCGGGGGGGGSPAGPSGLIAGFVSEPAANVSVSLEKYSVSGDTVYLAVKINSVDNVFGANLKIVYDETKATWGGTWQPGTFLEAGGATNYEVNLDGSEEEGLLLVGVAGSSEVSGSGTLIIIPFRVVAVASSEITFSTDSKLRDGTEPIPLEIPVSFTGGTISGS